jgi:hypothetical protein
MIYNRKYGGDNLTNQEIKKLVKWHLAPVKKLMRFSRQHKRKFYARIELSTQDYIKNRPDATTKEICEFLGDPANLVDDYKKEVGPDEIRKSYRRSKWITIGIVVFVLVALAAGSLWWLYDFMYHYTNITIVEYPVQ